MLVARARRPAAAATRADEAEHRMVVSEGRNLSGPVTTGTGLNGGGRNESPSTAPNAWKVAALDQAPDGGTGYPERTTRFVNRDHLRRHSTNRITLISLSQSSHALPAFHSQLELFGLRHQLQVLERCPTGTGVSSRADRKTKWKPRSTPTSRISLEPGGLGG